MEIYEYPVSSNQYQIILFLAPQILSLVHRNNQAPVDLMQWYLIHIQLRQLVLFF